MLDQSPGAGAWAFPAVRSQLSLGGGALATALTFVAAVDPNRSHLYPTCWLHQTTGLYCASCGATRALHALLVGHWLEAVHDNVLFCALLAVTAWPATRYLHRAWGENLWPTLWVDDSRLLRRGLLLLALALSFMLVRNLPGWPFALLRPLGPEGALPALH